MADAARIDIKEVIDRQGLRGYHYGIAALCAASVLMDGFDTQSIVFVAPALVEEWHIGRAALGPILSSGLAGMLIGALLFGSLGDRFGRKRILIVCTFWFGICSLLTARADSIQTMLVLRLITGLGLGGALPNATALTSEYMPLRRRATGVTLMLVGFSLGGAVGGVAAAGLIARFGWRAVFVAGGIVPCIVGVFLFALPESIRFLMLKGGQHDRVVGLLRKLAPEVPILPATSFVFSEVRAPGLPINELFVQGRAKTTLLIWTIFFVGLIDLYFLNGWLPTVIHDAGVALEQAIVITTFFHAGGAIGTIVLGLLIDRNMSYRPLVWGYLGGAVCVLAIANQGPSLVLEAVTLFGVGFGITGAHTAAYSLAAECYPTALRTTGIGWGVGIGRIGSILGPIIGGVLLSSGWGIRRVFLAAAVPPVIAALSAGALARRSALARDQSNTPRSVIDESQKTGVML